MPKFLVRVQSCLYTRFEVEAENVGAAMLAAIEGKGVELDNARSEGGEEVYQVAIPSPKDSTAEIIVWDDDGGDSDPETLDECSKCAECGAVYGEEVAKIAGPHHAGKCSLFCEDE